MIEVKISDKLPIRIDSGEIFILDEGENVKKKGLVVKNDGSLIIPDKTSLIMESS